MKQIKNRLLALLLTIAMVFTPVLSAAPVMADEGGTEESLGQDGEYTSDSFSFTFTGGSGKASMSCEKVIIQEGKATATLKASSANMTHVFLGEITSTEETPALFDPDTGKMGENVYAISDKSVTIPVELNKDVAIAARTTAMNSPHWVQYSYHITLNEVEEDDTSYSFSVQLVKIEKEVSDTRTAASVEGETIQVVDQNGVQWPISSSTTGSYYFRNLPKGTYTISATVPGYAACTEPTNETWNSELHGYVVEYLENPIGTATVELDVSKKGKTPNIGIYFLKLNEDVDYSEVDELLARVPSNMDLFSSGVAEVTEAVNLINRDATTQAEVDAVAEKLSTALQNLIPEDGIYEVSVKKTNATPYYLYEGLDASDKENGICLLTVKNGTMTAQVILKNQGYNYAFLGTKEEATAACANGEYSGSVIPTVNGAEQAVYNGTNYKYSTIEVPVAALETNISYAYHSASKAASTGWYDHKVLYKAASLKKLEAAEESSKTELTITNNTSMFKAVTAYVEKENGKANLIVALSGTSYQNLYKGTYEEAVTNGDNRANWIKGSQNADSKWEFVIPIEEGETYIPIVSISNTYLKKYENGENPLSRAFYPRQLEIDLEGKTLTAGDYEFTKSLNIKNTVSMFKPTVAAIHTIGGPNSNNYAAVLNLTMASDAYDKVFAGSAEDAEIEKSAISLKDGNLFEIPVKWVEKFGNPETLVSIVGKQMIFSFHSKKQDKWLERAVIINEAAEIIVFSTIDDKVAIDGVKELIEKARVDYDTSTEKQTAIDAAKASYEALTPERKEQLKATGMDPEAILAAAQVEADSQAEAERVEAEKAEADAKAVAGAKELLEKAEAVYETAEEKQKAVEAARAALKDLTEDQLALLKEKIADPDALLEKAANEAENQKAAEENAAAANKAADEAQKLIEAAKAAAEDDSKSSAEIAEAVKAAEEAIEEAQEAYSKLTDEQKQDANQTNVEKLAESAKIIIKAAEEKVAVKKAVETVTRSQELANNPDATSKEVEEAIAAAEEAVKDLSDEQKQQVETSVGTAVDEVLQNAKTSAAQKAEEEKKTAENGNNPSQGGKQTQPTPQSQTKPQTSSTVKVGTIFKVGKLSYKVTKATEVTLVKNTDKKAKSVTIPATVQYNGKNFNVTAIGAKAFAKNKKLTKVVIGKNIKTIGKQAFYGDKKLKTVTFKGVAVKKFGKKAFGGINKKATFKMPKKVKKTYKKKLLKAGASKTAKYK